MPPSEELPPLPFSRALVTGANGFLGAHLVRRLVARGVQVTCLLRPTSDVSALSGMAYSRADGDITDAGSLARAVAGQQVVFHLAGIRRAAVREEFLHVNAEGTRLLCEALVAAAPEGQRARLVFCGSLAASGPSSSGRPRVEEDPLEPREWYGESKAEGERIALSYAPRLPVTVVRPPRIVGPGDRENLVFFKLVTRGLKLHLAGGPRPLSLVDVEDVADLLLVLAEHPRALGEAFFVAGDTTLTLEQLEDLGAEALGLRPRTLTLGPRTLTWLASACDVATRVSGRRLPLNRKLARQLLAPAWTCSAAKAERLLGFTPRRGVVDSVRRSALWYREQGWL
ncbi:NAD-dependent epimerase/dehydratase family protein [Aggregicoccus sp. 17bor-14]|uniref:NAD-dependent epimerase/dehydratase family protein n=1 Tax=Myxococcaceae TaxID=31 RepID=UPI00129CD243|nr:MULTISPECIES: NAD-dependent epimerase/dehydratase family protein [Myxococcaceae]MBF5043839.1 NAD-dependent epimerase/dehydratase family protein [Simulacricoccus sp. 17bor-14]MRI89591.1 NAD-dependent epimerase/dehydratase family protein [Aggregicoccus sp. 17bor-14]